MGFNLAFKVLMYCEVQEIPKFISSYNFKIVIILDYVYSENLSQVEIVNEIFHKKIRKQIIITFSKKLKPNKSEESCCSLLKKIRSFFLASELYIKKQKIIIYSFFNGCESWYFPLV